jgi:Tol biopolymer transport system component
MKIIRIALAAVALTVLVGVPALTQSGQDLFQQALVKEQAAGDLNGAIAIYQRIVRDFTSDRALAAKALVQLGQCYEKLGSTEARKAYQRVVTDYADQADQLTLARARLAALAAASTPAPERPRFRKVGFPFTLSIRNVFFGAALSPDGKSMALGRQGALLVVPVEGGFGPETTGEPRNVAPAKGLSAIAWSADGNWIAFGGGQNMYVVSSRGGEPKPVAYGPPAGDAKSPRYRGGRLSLSPDGEVLAFSSAGEDGSSCVATVPVDGGVAKCVTESMSADPAFSPDGRHIAYIHASKVVKDVTTELRIEVRVIPANGGNPLVVTEVQGTAQTPVWSPDGRMIAFLVAPSGHSSYFEELWVVAVSERGTGLGTPTAIKLPLKTRGPLLGWGAGNRIGIELTSPIRSAIYTVPASGGNATQVTPERADQDGEKYDFPRWSPDGKTIWFLDGSMVSALGHVPAGGGTVTIVRTGSNPPVQGLPPGGGNDISPDGKRVVFAGFPREGKSVVGLWTMPLEGGQPVQLTKPVNAQDRFPCWTADGKSVLFIRDAPSSANIYAVPAEGGEPRLITSDSDKVCWGGIASSPDGKWVAYFAQDQISKVNAYGDTIKIKPLSGGEAKIVAKVNHAGGHEEISWSPDGKRLAYNAGYKLWVTSVDGGATPMEIRTGLTEASAHLHVDWSPDGNKIAFTHVRGGERELWLMEDFLPLLKAQERK